jgi:hypothetical protein
MKNLNRADDVRFLLNGSDLTWTGELYNHFDNGCWIDVLRFRVPVGILRHGSNNFTMRRTRENPAFAGAVELRKFVLDQHFATGFRPGRLD